jgi:acetyl-CoA carboxylase biotin carboxyl carrier protein
MKQEGIDELKELIAFLKENEIAEFELDRGDLKMKLKFASGVVQPAAATPGVDLASLARLMSSAGPVAPMVAAPVAYAPPVAQGGAVAEPPASGAAEPEEKLHLVKSPIVGTFYESPSPGSSAFVSNGDRVEKGQVLCIVEAMKLMNEIESDAAGEIVKRLVINGQPVEYGQPLFAVRTV